MVNFNIGFKETCKNVLSTISTCAKGANNKATEYLEQDLENRPARDLVASESAMADAIEAIDETNQRLAKCQMTREEFMRRLAEYQAAKQATKSK